MGSIFWQFQHLCLSFSSVKGKRAGSERAGRCYPVSAELHYHTISNKVSGLLGAALLPTPGHMFPFLCHFYTSTTMVSPTDRVRCSREFQAASYPSCREKREGGLQLLRLGFDYIFSKTKYWCKNPHCRVRDVCVNT